MRECVNASEGTLCISHLVHYLTWKGFETVTFILDGACRHSDSKGNSGVLGVGDVQVRRMKAHSTFQFSAYVFVPTPAPPFFLLHLLILI